MLDQKIQERARNLIHAERHERWTHLRPNLSSIISEAAARGGVKSGRTVHAVTRLMSDEIKARAHIAWNSLARVHTILGSPLTDTLAADLKREASIYIDEDTRELTEEMQRVLRWAPPDTITLSDAQVAATSKIHAEIDLYVDSLVTRAARSPQDSPPSMIHISGPVGAVQTGPGAVAHVIQNLAPDDKDALLAALALLKESLTAAQDVSGDLRQEMLQLIDDSEGELRKDRPVIARIRAFLSDVAATIQTIASAQPAYQALKAALVPLGIMLP